MEFVFLSWTFVQFCPKLEDLVMQKILVRRKVSPSHLKGDNVVFPIHVFFTKLFQKVEVNLRVMTIFLPPW